MGMGIAEVVAMIDMAPGWAAESRGMKLFDSSISFDISSGRCKWPVSLLPFVVALSYCSSLSRSSCLPGQL
jgi:hypothetical protein